MNFSINKASNITINEQIKYQLRFQILSGELNPGEKILSVRELASLLKVNRHTITKAYKDLEDEGLITARQYFGTFVTSDITLPKEQLAAKFLDIVKNAIKESRELGFSIEEFISVAQTINIREKSSHENVSAIFIECNTNALNQYVEDLKKQLSIDVKGCLIEDIEKGNISATAIGEFDLIITTMGHYPQVRQMLKKQDNIYAVNIGPYLRVISNLMAYPTETKIGIIALSKKGTAGIKQALIDVGIEEKRIIEYSPINSTDIKKEVNKSDLLVVSKFALAESGDELKSLGKEIIEYRNVLQKTSVKMLKDIVAQIKNTEKI